MARISDEFIQELLARTDMVAVVRQYVPSLKKSGSSYMGRCPFHDEKSPSFSIDPTKNLYHCFGCGVGGNTIGFVMRKAGMAYPDAVQELATMAGMEMPQQQGYDPQEDKRRQGIYEVLERASRYYQQQLQGDAGRAARDYLQKRGIDAATAKHFELGYAPAGWNNLGEALRVKDDLLLAASLVKRKEERGVYDVFRDRLMFPIRSHVRNRVVAFGGRVLRDEDKPKYMNSPESDVFSKRRELYGLYLQKEARKRADRVFIVEGYMDVVSMLGHGLPEAVAALGTAISSEQLQALFRLFPAVVFCFDGDNAGRTAANRALDNLLPLLHAKVDVQFMFLPEGEDPDSLVRRDGADALRQYASIGVLDFLRRQLCGGGDSPPDGADARARLITASKDRLNSLRDPVIRAVVMENMAKDFDMRSDLIEMSLLESADAKPKLAPNNIVKDDNSRSLMSYAVTLLLRQPNMIAKHAGQIKALPEVREKQFFSEWLEVVQRNPEISSGAMLEHWRGSSYDKRLQQLVAAPVLLDSAIAMEREFADVIKRLELYFYKNRMQALLAQGLTSLGEEQKKELETLRQLISQGSKDSRRDDRDSQASQDGQDRTGGIS